MLDPHEYWMQDELLETCDPLIDVKSLRSQGSLLYECLEMASSPQVLATPLRYLTEDQLESSVHVSLTIPKALLSGSSELTISLPTLKLSSDSQDTF